MGEWIMWEGGKCPVDDDVFVDLKLRCGEIREDKRPGAASWYHEGGNKWHKDEYDIVAYRLSTQEEAYEETEKPIGDSALNVQIGGDHYKHFQIQPVQYINANEMDFLQGSIIKYISRHKLKGGKADVEKAIHFCRLILELQYVEAR